MAAKTMTAAEIVPFSAMRSPDVVTFKAFALTNVEQLLGCCHGRLLSPGKLRLKKHGPARSGGAAL